jgi:hypothetical protein
VLGGGRRADDVRAARLGDLHRDMPHAAGRRVHQYPLSRLYLSGVDERLPGGQRHVKRA